MQSGKKIPKWQLRSRTGVNLGISNQHARSIVLVLNLTTGHISPQFHVKFDPKFQTVRESLGNLAPQSEWQAKCGFKPRRRNQRPSLKKQKKTTYNLRGRRWNIRFKLMKVRKWTWHKAESSARLKAKPRVNYNDVELARPREEDNVAFMTIAKESEIPKEVFALAASKDPDTMYYHESMREPDREQFKGAMNQEVEAHTKK
jgi:hypothetical protein